MLTKTLLIFCIIILASCTPFNAKEEFIKNPSLQNSILNCKKSMKYLDSLDISYINQYDEIASYLNNDTITEILKLKQDMVYYGKQTAIDNFFTRWGEKYTTVTTEQINKMPKIEQLIYETYGVAYNHLLHSNEYMHKIRLKHNAKLKSPKYMVLQQSIMYCVVDSNDFFNTKLSDCKTKQTLEKFYSPIVSDFFDPVYYDKTYDYILQTLFNYPEMATNLEIQPEHWGGGFHTIKYQMSIVVLSNNFKQFKIRYSDWCSGETFIYKKKGNIWVKTDSIDSWIM